MKRTDDRNDLIGSPTGSNRLLDTTPHVRFTHQVFSPPTWLIFLKFTNRCAQFKCRTLITTGRGIVLEVALPIGVVIALARERGDLFVERLAPFRHSHGWLRR